MRRLVPLLYFCCSFIWGQAQIVINEVMQANLYVYDEYKELPESWVEIYNLGDEAFPLEGYRVLYENEMFEFDSADFVQPHAFFMVYCDEKDAGNHAKFKLKTDKKTTMALLSPSGEVVDEFVIPIMKQAGVSYGRDADDGSQNGWLVSATPLAIHPAKKVLPVPVAATTRLRV